MSGTLYAANMLQSGMGYMISGLLGVMFGFFLEQAGFGSSRKLTAIFSGYCLSHIPFYRSTKYIIPQRLNSDATTLRVDCLSLINLGAKK